MSNNLGQDVDALLLSIAVSTWRVNYPDNYMAFKSTIKVASNILNDMSMALEDDYLSPEEVKRVFMAASDPYVRKAIQDLVKSFFANAQQKGTPIGMPSSP